MRDGAVEIRTQGDDGWQRKWTWEVKKEKRSRTIKIIRGKWEKVMWKSKKGKEVVYYYMWMNSVKPTDRELRDILHRQMGPKKPGYKVVVNNDNSAEETKEEGNKEMGRKWSMVVKKKGGGSYQVTTTVGQWYKVSKYFNKGLVPGSVVALKGSTLKKYCADEGRRVRCNRNFIRSWEKFTVADAGNGKIALKGGKKGRYCSVKRNKMRCSSRKIGEAEKFTIEELKDGRIALKYGKTGKFCSDRAMGIKCSKSQAGGQETFIPVLQGPAPRKPHKQPIECAWLKGPHKRGAQEPLCSNGVFSWKCREGGHGQRVQCPKSHPDMCEEKSCGGNKSPDHCCEPKGGCAKKGGLRQCPKGASSTGALRTWDIEMEKKPTRKQAMDFLKKTIGNTNHKLKETKSGDGIEEIKTQGGVKVHRIWSYKVEKKSKYYFVVITRTRWSKVMWKEQRGNEQVFHFEWSGSKPPCNRDQRRMLDKLMGKLKSGRQVIVKTNDAEEHKQQGGQEYVREYKTEVHKEMAQGGNGQIVWKIDTVVMPWTKIKKGIKVAKYKVQKATSCPWEQGPHKANAQEPLCEKGVFSWECTEGGHGPRVQCPAQKPYMCEEQTCGGGNDHCCEKKEELCRKGLRQCDKDTTTTTTPVVPDCGRLGGESFAKAEPKKKCEGGSKMNLNQANKADCERKCEALKKVGCCTHSGMFDQCTFYENGKIQASSVAFDKAIMCRA